MTVMRQAFAILALLASTVKSQLCIDSDGIGFKEPRSVTWEDVKFSEDVLHESFQCWRAPACIQHEYLTLERCSRLTLDEEWPDPGAGVRSRNIILFNMKM